MSRPLEHGAAQLTLEADLELVGMLKEHLKHLETQIIEQIQTCEYEEVINALMCYRGIDVTTGFGLAVEIGDWTRFTGSSLGSYVGLVPSEHSSGGTRSQGPITKAGNTYVRRLLVEAAWQHERPYARPAVRLVKQFQLVDAATRARAMEGNRRLHHVWEQFNKRGKLRRRTPRSPASWLYRRGFR